MLLPGKTEWFSVSVEYAIDVCCEVKGSNAQRIKVGELPSELTQTFDFGRLRESIREVYKLS